MRQFLYQPPFGVEIIRRILPHRYPFLLVDGVTELGETLLRGFKNLSANEEVFQGHFPDHPVYPGVMHIETLAQVGAVWLLNQPENVGKIAYLMTVDNVKIRRPAVPGDRLDVVGEVVRYRGSSGRVEGHLMVGNQVVSEMVISFAIARQAAPAGAGIAAPAATS
jgi:3-hydroxyacyl-[acyl-carrier-protein] dehydratase